MLRMMTRFPTVSVVIPVYNHEKYIRECVESALDQDYRHLEVTVVDDGSTDATPEILKEFSQRIQYIRQENGGTAAALNNGIRHAKGSLFAWLSSDDVYLAGKIRRQIEEFQKNPSLALIYTDYIKIDAQGNELELVNVPCPPAEQFVRAMLERNFINGSTVLMRMECFEKVGYYDENFRADQDGDMWFRLLKHGYQFGHIPTPFLKYRWHSSNTSHNSDLMQSCKDQVRLKAIQAFSPEEIFGDVISNGQSVSAAYETLACALFLDFNFKAAEATLRKAYELR